VIDLSQYVFEVLRKDDEFVLYRGRSRDDGSSGVLAVSPVAGWKVKGVNGAAELLGVKPTTLFARIEKLGLKRPA
jgi:hypothetical protein